jgi:hypothetical protein
MPRKIIGLALLLAGAFFAPPLLAQGFAFTGLLNRFVTPNGDGKNDAAVFQYSNQTDSAGTIRIYELRGRQVGSVSIESGCVANCSAAWDPRGQPNGVYIYVFSIDQTSKSGVLVVVR